MRIGLLTHHWVPNFGANLQAFCSITAFRRMGCDIEVLNYRNRDLIKKYTANVPATQFAAHQAFVSEQLPESPLLQTEQDLINYCMQEQHDLIVAGSDSIFRLDRRKTTDEGAFPNPYWLQWARSACPRARVAVLAGSTMGSMLWAFPSATRRKMSEIIMAYDYISVRDRWTRLQFAGLTRGRCRPAICPDPTAMLFSTIDQKPYLNRPKLPDKKYLLLSFRESSLGSDWIRDFTAKAHGYGYAVYSLPLPERELHYPVDYVIPLPLDPLEWYWWIRNSAGLIAERFHPIVCAGFSGVPFLSIDNNAGYWHRIPVRIKSKQYDFCMNIGKRTKCWPQRQLPQLRAQNAISILNQWDAQSVEKYIRKSAKTFMTMLKRTASL